MTELVNTLELIRSHVNKWMFQNIIKNLRHRNINKNPQLVQYRARVKSTSKSLGQKREMCRDKREILFKHDINTATLCVYYKITPQPLRNSNYVNVSALPAKLDYVKTLDKRNKLKMNQGESNFFKACGDFKDSIPLPWCLETVTFLKEYQSKFGGGLDLEPTDSLRLVKLIDSMECDSSFGSNTGEIIQSLTPIQLAMFNKMFETNEKNNDNVHYQAKWILYASEEEFYCSPSEMKIVNRIMLNSAILCEVLKAADFCDVPRLAEILCLKIRNHLDKHDLLPQELDQRKWNLELQNICSTFVDKVD